MHPKRKPRGMGNAAPIGEKEGKVLGLKSKGNPGPKRTKLEDPAIQWIITT